MSTWTRSGVMLSGATGAGTLTVTDLPSKPRVVFLATDLQTATGFGAGAVFGYGWGALQDDNSYTQACLQGSADDGVATWSSRRGQYHATTPRCLFLWSNDGATHLLELGFTSCDATGFTLNKIANSVADQRIYWFAVGGSDAASWNVQGGQMVMQADAAPYDQTESGLTFEPELLAFLFARRATDGSTTQIEQSFGFSGPGAATPPQWAIGMAANTGASSLYAHCRQASDAVIAAPSPSSSSGAMECNVKVKSTQGTGFTVTWQTKTATVSALLPWLAIRGPKIALGTVAKTTAGAPVNQDVTGLAQAVQGVLLGSFGAAATTSGVADGRTSLGFSDGTTHGAIWVWHTNGGTSVAKRANVGDKAIRLATAPSTTDAEASVSFITGGFRLAWSTNNAVADAIGYLAFGEQAGPVKGEVTVIGP